MTQWPRTSKPFFRFYICFFIHRYRLGTLFAKNSLSISGLYARKAPLLARLALRRHQSVGRLPVCRGYSRTRWLSRKNKELNRWSRRSQFLKSTSKQCLYGNLRLCNFQHRLATRCGERFWRIECLWKSNRYVQIKYTCRYYTTFNALYTFCKFRTVWNCLIKILLIWQNEHRFIVIFFLFFLLFELYFLCFYFFVQNPNAQFNFNEIPEYY